MGMDGERTMIKKTGTDTMMIKLQRENALLRKQAHVLQKKLAKALLALELDTGCMDAAVLVAEIVEAKSRLRVNNLHSIKHLQQMLDNVLGGPDRMRELQLRLMALQLESRKVR
jgi:hypothetical protein